MNLGIFNRIRRNHALEHATIAVARNRFSGQGILGGSATPWGFFIYGNISTDMLVSATNEALERLRAGEEDLAVSPYCGTNLVIGSVVVGLACAWLFRYEYRWSKIPSAISAALSSLVVSRPLGSLVQKHLTTNALVADLTVNNIVKLGVGSATAHKIFTSKALPNDQFVGSGLAI